ncbi:30S ribosomal protein S1 [uncultured Victivallis sp.]|uniref:30S ribosomal protein S1 n=1 Tax=uncultured Victivallis sp. TaxID=354118 RepID=UPI0025FC420E|nr:30S ribosomal protein S1 [uncultured Victivallis sp.]
MGKTNNKSNNNNKNKNNMAEENKFADSFLDFSNIPGSMDELLASSQSTNAFTKGKIVAGTVVAKRPDGALVDIGYKAEGFVPAGEFLKFDEVAVGDKIDVYLEEIENRNNMPELSLEKANSIKAWNRITTEYGEGYVVKGFMRHRVKGGIMVDVEGFPAFLPGSQLDVGPVHNMDDYIGKEFDVKIIKINQDRRNIVVSRRELLEESLRESRSKLLSEMKVDDLRKGVVKNITDFGAFIDLGGVDGLLHITDISWGRISHPSEVLSVGQELEVVIIGIDKEKERVSLGLKQKTRNPWDDVVAKYPKGSRIKGRVVNIMPYGAFVEIETGVEGLIHVSEMSWTKRISKASDVLSIGDEVEAVVLDIDRDSRKISLGLRQKERNPWEVLAEKYPVGRRIKGKVRNMTSYGAFVEIENDIDGMIHVSDMSWTRKINNPNEVLKPGMEVEAVILDINPEQQRISLGLKQAESDPWANIDELYKVGDIVKGKVTKIAQFGAFVELSNKIDGLIHISQLSRDHVDKVKDVLNVGDEVEARVIKVDNDERRIGLSIKAVGENFSPEDLKAAEEEYTAALKPGEAMVDMGEVFSNESLAGLKLD